MALDEAPPRAAGTAPRATPTPKPSRVAAVILAAGASTRLGHPKQLVLLQGERLLDRAIRIARAAGCDPVVIVLGSHAERIAKECDLTRVLVVHNGEWQEGLASSIQAGISALPKTAEAAIVMTCDQPAVSPQHLILLMAACREQPSASSYAGRKGIPACFSRGTFGLLEALRGDGGAKHLLVSATPVDLLMGELDVDTEEALEAARSLFK